MGKVIDFPVKHRDGTNNKAPSIRQLTGLEALAVELQQRTGQLAASVLELNSRVLHLEKALNLALQELSRTRAASNTAKSSE
jgi:hypothetical protein